MKCGLCIAILITTFYISILASAAAHLSVAASPSIKDAGASYSSIGRDHYHQDRALTLFASNDGQTSAADQQWDFPFYFSASEGCDLSSIEAGTRFVSVDCRKQTTVDGQDIRSDAKFRILSIRGQSSEFTIVAADGAVFELDTWHSINDLLTNGASTVILNLIVCHEPQSVAVGKAHSFNDTSSQDYRCTPFAVFFLLQPSDSSEVSLRSITVGSLSGDVVPRLEPQFDPQLTFYRLPTAASLPLMISGIASGTAKVSVQCLKNKERCIGGNSRAVDGTTSIEVKPFSWTESENLAQQSKSFWFQRLFTPAHLLDRTISSVPPMSLANNLNRKLSATGLAADWTNQNNTSSKTGRATEEVAPSIDEPSGIVVLFTVVDLLSGQSKEYVVELFTEYQIANARLADVSVELGSLQPAKFSPFFGVHYVYAWGLSLSLRVTAFLETTKIFYDGTEMGTGTAEIVLWDAQPKYESTYVEIETHLDWQTSDGHTKWFVERYLFIVVPYANNFLASLEVIGGLSEIDFSPDKFSYVTTVGRHTLGVAFKAEPQSPKATVSVGYVAGGFADATPVDPKTGYSKWLLVHKGEIERFVVYVKHPGTAVMREYEMGLDINPGSRKQINLSPIRLDKPFYSGKLYIRILAFFRPSVWYASYGWTQRLANTVGFTSFIVSAVSGGGFITNTKLLHFISMTNALRGNPEAWHDFSTCFNKFNVQIELYHSDNDDDDDVDIFEFETSRLVASMLTNMRLSIGRAPSVHTNVSNGLGDCGYPSGPGRGAMFTYFRCIVEDPDLPSRVKVRKLFSPLVETNSTSFENNNKLVEQLSNKLLLEWMAALLNTHELHPFTSPMDVRLALSALFERWDEEAGTLPPRRFLEAAKHESRSSGSQEMTEEDYDELLNSFNQKVRQQAKFRQYFAALQLSIGLLLGGMTAYAIVWALYLRKDLRGNFFKLRQDYPSVLRPGRFFIFLCDYMLISCGQASIGLVTMDPKIVVQIDLDGLWIFPQKLEPKHFNTIWWIAAVTLTIYPILFATITLTILLDLRKQLTYNRDMERWVDRECRELKAVHELLPLIPIINNFFTVEINSTVPIQHPKCEGLPLLLSDPQSDALTGKVLYGGLPWFIPHIDYLESIAEELRRTTNLSRRSLCHSTVEKKRSSIVETVSQTDLTEPLMPKSQENSLMHKSSQMSGQSVKTVRLVDTSSVDETLPESKGNKVTFLNKVWGSMASGFNAAERAEKAEKAALLGSKFFQPQDAAASRQMRALLSTSSDMPSLEYEEIDDFQGGEVRVDFDEAVFSESYMEQNAHVFLRYPKASVGYNMYTLKNAYDKVVQFRCRVEIRHIVPLMQMIDFFTLWVPPSRLQLKYWDRFQSLIQDCPNGRFYAFAIDRICTLLVILAISSQRIPGSVQCAIFAFACLLIGLSHVVPGLIKGREKWLGDGRELFRAEQDQKLGIGGKVDPDNPDETDGEKPWPFSDPQVYADFKAIQQQRFDSRFCGLAGIGRRCIRPVWTWISSMPAWKTRLTYTILEIVLNPTLTELLKCGILMGLCLTHADIIKRPLVDTDAGSAFSMICTVIAVYLTNIRCLQELYFQLKSSLQAAGYWISTLTHYLGELFSTLPVLKLKVKFYADTISDWMRMTSEEAARLNWTFPEPALGVRMRDIRVQSVQLVVPNLGMMFEGEVVRPKNRNLSTNESGRHAINKTIYSYGRLGVVRVDMDHSLPMEVSFRDFYQARDAALSRLVATIHILNHTRMRYRTGRTHPVEDDSFLSLYTDPVLVPPAGHIRVPSSSHGYAVRFDAAERVVRVIGPRIQKNMVCTLKTRGQTEQASWDKNQVGQPEELACTQTVLCRETGRLEIPVPRNKAPCLEECIRVGIPGGTSITIDPKETKCDYDKYGRELLLRSRYFHKSNIGKYKVTWKTARAPSPLPLIEAVAEKYGVVAFGVPHYVGYPDLTLKLELQLGDMDPITVDPLETDAFQFVLTVPESNQSRFRAVRNKLAEWCACCGHGTKGAWEEPVPCTIAHCVDPDLHVYRVIPKEQLLAVRSLLEGTAADLGTVAATVFSEVEYLNFWVWNGVRLVENGYWKDPLTQRHHPIVAKQLAEILLLEPLLIKKVRKRIDAQIAALDSQLENLGRWKTMYEDNELQEAQAEVDLKAWSNNKSAIRNAQKHVRRLLRRHKGLLPTPLFPMDVDRSLLQPMPSLTSQFRLWREALTRWLLLEVGASEDPSDGSVEKISYLDTVNRHILSALKLIMDRPENISQGTYKTVLHFVCNSRYVVGKESIWRPDPLCAHAALVRVWRVDMNDPTDKVAHNEPPVWLPCSLKLTGTCLRILMPNKRDTEREFRSLCSFEQITGWSVPIHALEKIQVERDIPLPPECSANPFFKDMSGRITFITNLEAKDREFVRRVEDGVRDNLITIECAEDEENRSSSSGNAASLSEDEDTSISSDTNLNRGPRIPLLTKRGTNEKKTKYASFAERNIGRDLLTSAAPNSSLNGSPRGGPAVKKFRLLTKVRLPPAQAINYPDRVQERDSDWFFCCHLQIRCGEPALSAWESLVRATRMHEQPPWTLPGEAVPIVEEEELSVSSASSSLLSSETAELSDSLPASVPSSIAQQSLDEDPDLFPDQMGSDLDDDISDSITSEPSNPSPSAKEETAKDVPLPQEFEGKFQTDGFSGKGRLYDAEGKLIYNGDFLNDRRWGRGLIVTKLLHNGQTYKIEGRCQNNTLIAGPVLIRWESDKRSLLEMRDNYKLDPQLGWILTEYEGLLLQHPTLKRQSSFPTSREGVLHKSAFEREQLLRQSGVTPTALNVVFDTRDTLSDYGEEKDAGTISADDEFLDELSPAKLWWLNRIDPRYSYDQGVLARLSPEGKSSYLNGATYTGERDNKGVPHGTGTLVMGNMRFVGGFKHGKAHGLGRMFFNDDDREYEGNFEDGLRNGTATLRAPNTELMTKEVWRNGELVSMSLENKDFIELFAKNVSVEDGVNFEGHWTCADKTRCKGTVRNGALDGFGTIIDDSGEVLYDGQFTKGVPHGSVRRLVLNDGKIYAGSIEKGHLYGYGVLYDPPSGMTISGCWKNGVLDGTCQIDSTAGTYEGDVKKGRRDGRGMFTFKALTGQTAEEYVGSWRNDVPHGTGVFIDQTGRSYNVAYSNGVLSNRPMCVNSTKIPAELETLELNLPSYKAHPHTAYKTDNVTPVATSWGAAGLPMDGRCNAFFQVCRKTWKAADTFLSGAPPAPVK